MPLNCRLKEYLSPARLINIFCVCLSTVYYVRVARISFGYQFVRDYTLLLMILIAVLVGYLARTVSPVFAGKVSRILVYSCMLHLFSGIQFVIFDIKYCHLILVTVTALMIMHFENKDYVIDRIKRMMSVKTGITVLVIEFCCFAYSIDFVYEWSHSTLFVATVCIILYLWTMLFVAWMTDGFDSLASVITAGNKRDYRGSKGRIISERTGNVIKALILFGMVMIVGLIVSVIWYPGYFSDDNPWTYELAVNIGDPTTRTDISSFFYVIIFKVFSIFTHNYYPITLCILFLFSIAWTCSFMMLHRLGLRYGICVLTTTFFLMIPSNWLMIISSWKDTPFSICMFTVTTLLIRYVFYCNKRINFATVHYILLGVLLLFAALLRSNGQFIMIGLCIVAAVLVVKRIAEKKLLVTLTISLLCLVVIKGGLYNALSVKLTSPSLTQMPMIDVIWENVVGDKELSNESMAYIESIMPVEDWKAYYRRASLNIFVLDVEKLDTEKTLSVFKECLLKHPLTCIKARLKRTYSLWGVFPSRTFYSPLELPVDELSANSYGWKLNPKYLSLRRWISYLSRSTSADSNSYIGTIVGIFKRCGFSVVCWLLLGVWLRKKKAQLMMLSVCPAIMNAIVLMVACCYQDYRYSWPMFIMTILTVIGSVLLVWTIKNEEVTNQ